MEKSISDPQNEAFGTSYRFPECNTGYFIRESCFWSLRDESPISELRFPLKITSSLASSLSPIPLTYQSGDLSPPHSKYTFLQWRHGEPCASFCCIHPAQSAYSFCHATRTLAFLASSVFLAFLAFLASNKIALWAGVTSKYFLSL